MTKNKLVKIKIEKGFTIYDLIVAIIVFSMFATIIGTLIVTTYKVQATTEAEEVATLYVIQIVEYIDKIDFDEVTNELSQTLPQKFNIPEAFTVEIQATDYKPNENTQAYIKNVNVNLSYNFVGEQKNITIKKIKNKGVIEMKSERGVTLTSLAIYIIVATLVVSTMALLSSHTFLNMKILKDQATYAVEYNKFNMFFIEDVKSNKTANVTDTQITFTDGNKYEYKDKSIYRNEKKIAKDVETCTFTAGTYTIKNTTKNLITVNLKIGTGEKKYQKEIEYVLRYW